MRIDDVGNVEYFADGVALGAVTAAVAVFATRRNRAPAPLGGLAVALAAGMAMRLGDQTHLPSGASSTRVAVAVAVAIVASATAWFDDTADPALGLPFLALSAAGIYLAVPDTEAPAALLGATVVIAPLGWPLRRVRLGRFGAVAATSVAVWALLVGARGRPLAAVGALACVGMLTAVPVARVVSRGRRRPRRLLLVCGHVAVVLVAARVVASVDDTWLAVVGTALVFAAAVAFGWLGGAPARSRSGELERRS